MFKFLKRLRGDKAQTQASEPVFETQELASDVHGTVLPEDPMSQRHQGDFDLPASEPQIAQSNSDSIEQPPSPDSAKSKEAPSDDREEAVQDLEPVAIEVEEVELPKRGLGSGIRSLFSAEFDLEGLEDILLQADFGLDAANEITAELKKLASYAGANSDAQLRLLLKDLLTQRLSRSDAALNLSSGDLPYIILVVGVNGAGKTTTIGKLSAWLRDGDWNVVVGAADTFRAAAVDQLATWATRAGARIVRPEREGQDPASVAYQTVEFAVKQQADIAIIDTAGRLQNKKDLMDELAKIRKAVEKQARISEVLLVIDATTGQNALAQARAFTEVADVTGIVMTKLDGTAKGGILYSLQEQLDLPVKLVGVGEGVNDFAFFSAEEFAKGLVAPK